MKTFFELTKYLSSGNKKGLILSFFLIVFSGFIDFLSITIVVPFLGIISNPDFILGNNFINENKFFSFILNFKNPTLIITILFCSVILLAGFLRLFSLKYNSYQSARLSSDLGIKAYKSIIFAPYNLHLNFKSSNFISILSISIPRISTAFMSFLQLINSLVQLLFILSALFFINFSISISAILIFSSSYLLIIYFTRRKFRKNSKTINNLIIRQTKSIQDGLGSVKDIKLSSNQEMVIDKYSNLETKLREIFAENNYLTIFPRYALEPLGIVFIAFIGYTFVINSNIYRENSLAILGAFALGAQKLLPALQQIYAGWSMNKRCSEDFDRLLKVLSLPKEKFIKPKRISPKIVKFKSVNFHYSNNKKEILKNLNFSFKKGNKIGIIGKSGSGKSTFIDILMGLLPPTSGKLLIDEIDVSQENNFKKLFAWRSSLAHVPQDIFLIDASIEENIAFGINKKNINQKRIKEVAKVACIDELLSNNFKKEKSYIGERGKNLSGGQRQRIGIARALYRNLDFLILDEATNSLDSETEQNILKNITNFKKEISLIIVTHKISTLNLCDEIYKINKGNLEIVNL